jgi:hypothetical protein
VPHLASHSLLRASGLWDSTTVNRCAGGGNAELWLVAAGFVDARSA